MRANLLGKDLLATTLLDRLVLVTEGKDTVLSEFGIQMNFLFSVYLCLVFSGMLEKNIWEAQM